MMGADMQVSGAIGGNQAERDRIVDVALGALDLKLQPIAEGRPADVLLLDQNIGPDLLGTDRRGGGARARLRRRHVRAHRLVARDASAPWRAAPRRRLRREGHADARSLRPAPPRPRRQGRVSSHDDHLEPYLDLKRILILKWTTPERNNRNPYNRTLNKL